MPKLPRLTARQRQIYYRFGKARILPRAASGSHMIYRNAAGKRATMPFHTSKILHPKVLRSILRDADLKPQDLSEML